MGQVPTIPYPDYYFARMLRENGFRDLVLTCTYNLNLYAEMFRQRFSGIQVTLQIGAVNRSDIHLGYGFNQGLCPQAPPVIQVCSERIPVRMAGKNDGRRRTGFGMIDYRATRDQDN